MLHSCAVHSEHLQHNNNIGGKRKQLQLQHQWAHFIISSFQSTLPAGRPPLQQQHLSNNHRSNCRCHFRDPHPIFTVPLKTAVRETQASTTATCCARHAQQLGNTARLPTPAVQTTQPAHRRYRRPQARTRVGVKRAAQPLPSSRAATSLLRDSVRRTPTPARPRSGRQR